MRAMKCFLLLVTVTAFCMPEAFAQGGPPEPQAPWPLYIILFIILWFFILRPPLKKQKEHGQMVQSLRKGDKVITGGGFEAVITKVDEDNMLELEIAPDVRVRAVQGTIADVVSRGKASEKEQLKDDKSKNKKSKGDSGKSKKTKK